MVRLLSDGDVADLLDLGDLLPVIADAFVQQGRGAVERPDRPHFPVGTGIEGPDPLGTGLTMPAYIHGAAHFATKLVTVHPDNPARGLPTVNAQVALTDAATGRPAAFMAGNRITNARTACIGGLAARELAVGPVRLGLVGAGTLARWLARAVAAATDVERIRVYSPSGSRFDCADELADELGIQTEAVDAPADAVRPSSVVATATTSAVPVFPGSALAPGTLVVAVGAYSREQQELDAETVAGADRVFADVPEEVAGIGDIVEAGLAESDLVPFSAVFEGRAGRGADDEIIVVDSVGSAVLDAATADHLYSRAVEAGVGTEIRLE